MTDQWAMVLVGAFGLLGTTGAAYIANLSRVAGNRAADAAETAAEHSKPVSNGFTREVRDGMAEILAMATDARDSATRAEDAAKRAEDKVDRHLEAHANAQVAPLRRAATW